eukprot:1149214-Pelagomonas_calceolata.AAC.12
MVVKHMVSTQQPSVIRRQPLKPERASAFKVRASPPPPPRQGKPAQARPSCSAAQSARAAWAAVATVKGVLRKLPMAAGEHGEGNIERMAVMRIEDGSEGGGQGRNKHGVDLTNEE